MSYGTGLSIITYSLASHNYLEQLISADMSADVTDVMAHGAADRYEIAQAVKIGQKLTFKHKNAGQSGQNALSNLDISSVNIGGTEYVGLFRSGSIKAVTKVKDAQIAANGYKTPVPMGTAVTVDAEMDISAAADLVAAIMADTLASLSVAVTITYGTESLICPMLLSSGTHTVAREELQTQKVSLKLRGTPTSPSAINTSLLGEILLGSALVGIDVDTGYNTYVTSTAVITELTQSFQDSQLIDMSGTMEVQGAFTVTGG